MPKGFKTQDTKLRNLFFNGIKVQNVDSSGEPILPSTTQSVSIDEINGTAITGDSAMPIGGEAVTTQPTAVTDGDNVTSIYTKYKELIIAGYDYALDSLKVVIQNPIWSRYCDPVELDTAVDLTTSFVDFGSEIPCTGYKTLNLFNIFVANDSVTNTFQVLAKHTAAGADEYVLEASIDYQKILGDNDTKVVYSFDITGIPYVQVQVKSDTIGTTPGVISTTYTKTY